jgi:hypothetical protein
MQVHPSQISPAESFDVFYFIRNHTDANTYYVRARIYDVRTGELLDTVNLSQSPTNSRLFIKTLQAPADPVGMGRNIVAIATVYTDSAYTTRSDDYEEQEQYYLIKAIPPIVVGGGGGIDPRSLSDMLDGLEERIARRFPKAEKPQDFPSEQLFGTIGVLHREIGRIPKDVFDPKHLHAHLDSIKSSIESIPQPEPVDLAPVMEAIRRIPELIRDAIDEAAHNVKLTGVVLAQDQKATLDRMAQEIVKKASAGLEELMSRQELTIPLFSIMSRKEPQPAQAEPPFHIM